MNRIRCWRKRCVKHRVYIGIPCNVLRERGTASQKTFCFLNYIQCFLLVSFFDSENGRDILLRHMGIFQNDKALQPRSVFVIFLAFSFGFRHLSSQYFMAYYSNDSILEGFIAAFSLKLQMYLCNVLNLLKCIGIIIIFINIHYYCFY
jgi:hypothetical protein